MGENIYQAPQADLHMIETKRGSPIKAVLIAATVDIVGSAVVSILMGIAYAAFFISRGMPIEQVKNLSFASLWSPFGIINCVFGSLFSIYAGYLCASIVNHREYRIVTILALLSTAVGFLLDGASFRLSDDIFLCVLTFACIYLGAWVHVRRKEKKRD
ncbi:MAG TPA: hypothetical protein VIF60_01250 [Burkholderiaceae bacterium]|jgi:hypothetical protein